jgi:hypothetical protein
MYRGFGSACYNWGMTFYLGQMILVAHFIHIFPQQPNSLSYHVGPNNSWLNLPDSLICSCFLTRVGREDLLAHMALLPSPANLGLSSSMHRPGQSLPPFSSCLAKCCAVSSFCGMETDRLPVASSLKLKWHPDPVASPPVMEGLMMHSTADQCTHALTPRLTDQVP